MKEIMKLRLRRPCKKCGKMFDPFAKRQKVCLACTSYNHRVRAALVASRQKPNHSLLRAERVAKIEKKYKAQEGL